MINNSTKKGSEKNTYHSVQMDDDRNGEDEKLELTEIEKEDDDEDEQKEITAESLTSIIQQLFFHAKKGNIDEIKAIIKSQEFEKDNINAQDDEGILSDGYQSNNTALHFAVENNHLEVVKLLYHLEANVEYKNKLGSTPLHVAASLGFTSIVDFLIEKSANTEATNKIGNTPLHCAVYSGHVEVTQSLLEQYGSKREKRDALLSPNGVGMAAAKYTAHDPMKKYLLEFFPRKDTNTNNVQNHAKHNENIEIDGQQQHNDVEEEEAEPINQDN